MFLDKEWKNTHLNEIKTKAGNRYTPKLNVDLPICEIFDGISRTKEFYTSIRTHCGELEREFSYISKQYSDNDIQKSYRIFSKNIVALLGVLKKYKEYSANSIDWRSISLFTKSANEEGWKLIDKLRSEKERLDKEKTQEKFEGNRSPSERISSDMHYLYEVQKELRYFNDFSSGSTAQLSNKPFLFLKGIAGSGKTHLLCDLMEKRGDDSLISVLVFGEFFSSGDMWKQFRTQLGLSQIYDKNKILKLLDQKGKKTKARSIIIIDALNESKPLNFWRNRLASLCREIKEYPNIALIVSIRSGFEQEILTHNAGKSFVIEEHHGFRFKEWQAVNKFFHEFSLPLPEIPVLTPEFQNPLFLLLFCKAFEDRAKKNKNSKKSKQIFRGHEGATYIFENFVKSIADRIATQLDLPKGRMKNGDYVIWDTVIEKVAQEMVEQNVDRISEEKLKDIAMRSHPNISASNLITAMEKNLILVKVPRYSPETHESDGFDYRFPFQKFSDHLLGRYIFKKLRTSKKEPQRFFSKRTKFGKFLSKGWNRGAVEALCIQCPEQLKGTEFFEIAPYVDDLLMVDAFIESLIWRRPNAFTSDTKQAIVFINQKVVRRKDWHDKLLNAFLTISAVPEHPFNALFLYRHLSKFTMPKRDSRWCPFLHYQYGNHEAVDRLIEWAWSNQDKSHVSDQSTKLYAVALSWFLASSNRFVRDKTTKALVSLLTGRLNVLTEVLEQFKEINDPYILERLYAVAYGCSLRDSSNKKYLRQLSLWFIKNVFAKGKIPTHIMIRGYARGVIEVAFRSGQLSIRTYQKTKLPYKSKWPDKVPSEKLLRDKYYPKDLKTDDRGYLSIWSSAIGSLGDFGRYEVESALSHWSGRRINRKQIPRKQLFEQFKQHLNTQQLALLGKLNPFAGISLRSLKVLIKYVDPTNTQSEADRKKQEQEERQKYKTAIKEFKESLDKRKRTFFEQEIEPYLDDRGGVNDPLDRFDTDLGQRWIFNRVVQLGWDPKLHGEFDNNINRYDNSGRSAHKSERIGKKYQWIALFELLAFVADNFEFKEASWSEKESNYEGAWQLWAYRDIDPSCVLRDKPTEEPDDVPLFHRLVPKFNAWQQSSSIKTWIRRSRNLPNPTSIIELIDIKGNRWVVLEGFCEWQEETPPEYKKYDLPTRTLYYMFKSYLVKERNKDKFLSWGKKQSFYGRWMPESHEFIQVFLREFPLYPAFLDARPHDWIKEPRHGKQKMPSNVLVTDEEYLNEGSTHDCSLDESISVKLPAKWIVDRMNLQQKYTDGRFYDKAGDLVVCNPAAFNRQPPSFLLMRKDKLLTFLRKGKCSIFWTLLGEKQTIGGGEMGQPYGWQEISGAYTFDKRGTIIGSVASKLKQPTPQSKPKQIKKTGTIVK